MNAYHGTLEVHALNICRHGFSEERFPSWTGDLGRGVYGYIEAPDKAYAQPKHLALSYARIKFTSRPQFSRAKLQVLGFEVRVEDEDVCDLNEQMWSQHFIRNRVNMERALHEKIRRAKSTSGASIRDNEDGFLIELLILRHLWRDFAVIIHDTYTAFQAKNSGFPNGREICVRDLSRIKMVEPV